MKPIGPLMWEHRLIEKMLGHLMRHIDKAETDKKINPIIIDTAVDFIRMYADRTHHGKEEEILFRDLAQKELTAELKKTMQELFDEQGATEFNEFLEKVLQYGKSLDPVKLQTTSPHGNPISIQWTGMVIDRTDGQAVMFMGKKANSKE